MAVVDLSVNRLATGGVENRRPEVVRSAGGVSGSLGRSTMGRGRIILLFCLAAPLLIPPGCGDSDVAGPESPCRGQPEAARARALESSPRYDFYAGILRDFSSGPTFMSIRVRAGDALERIVISSGALFCLLADREQYDVEEYQRVVMEHLLSGEPLSIGPMTAEYWSCTTTRRYRPVPAVDELASRGQRALIDAYFRRVAHGDLRIYVERNEASTEEMTAVITKLFDWGIACARDCETGFIILLGAPTDTH
jgi:hypothetical protein